MTNKTKITKTKAIIGKKIEKKDMMTEVTVSMIDTSGFPNPAVTAVDVNLEAPAALLMVAAVPPPAIMASAHVITGLKSARVDTITAVPATVANGMAMVSNKLSTKGMKYPKISIMVATPKMITAGRLPSQSNTETDADDGFHGLFFILS